MYCHISCLVCNYLQAKILNLEVDLNQERQQKHTQSSKHEVDEITESFKNEVQISRNEAKRLEKEISNIITEKEKLMNELEDMKKQYSNLEKRMKAGNLLLCCDHFIAIYLF